ncbi:MAG TPA: hypothetical protein IAC83_04420 [Euryarchaeota archaeon]|nr:hypothetical protein [Euryarchaeota archaeon]
MADDRYERELSFIESEVRHLKGELDRIREVMPVDPADALRKADEALGIESKIGALLQRKRQIEDSFIAAGAGAAHRDAPAETAPAEDVDELTAEIESVTDELMGIEIKMLRADMNGDESEKQKLSMMASSLRSRRDTLVERVKELKAESQQTQGDDDLESRVLRLEEENRSLGRQVSELKSEISDLRGDLGLIMRRLGIDD